ncbi:putative phosphatidylinositol 4-phosphate 5-kinase MSS4 [Nosema granulosis]|uniref:Phosphatidylinositol 4-phosphate 5-kinase MSS4 n=1 Tax=Nosema granulosis TaxID=83296 RepID=A0A9P6GY32_9MICR|nr:putative phosphatidylinositol 4-phosphate 5-kinase MSS4 [Nosema granulosis]
MIHRKIRIVLRLIDAVDKKSCYLRMSTEELNMFRVDDNRILEYSPKSFLNLRRLFGTTSLNLDHRYIFNSKVHSNSGSIFFFSSDFKYIIKTIRENERRTLIEFIDRYYAYIKQNPNTLLSKILGCYALESVSFCALGCVGMDCTHRYNVLIMKNIFRDTKIDRIYDLKGKDLHRTTNSYIKKDIEWCKDANKPIISQERLGQMQKDVQFLAGNNIMDYSLLVYYTGPERDTHFKLYDGDNNDVYKASITNPETCEYAFGIVDILTQYTCLKKTEWMCNTFCLCKNKSSLNPKDYADRLLKIVEDTFIVKE